MEKQYRIAVVYTGMPVTLVESIESALRAEMKGAPYTVLTLSDPSIIADAIQNGQPSREAAGRLLNLYQTAMNEGADAVLNACSSVGGIADEAKRVFALAGLPIIRIDEGMARAAVRDHGRIGVVATLSSTLEPTKGLLRRVAGEEGRTVTLVDFLASGAFGKTNAEMDRILPELLRGHETEVDCFLLAQGSMAGCAGSIGAVTGRPVYASPGYGARAVADALLGRGERR